MKGALTVIKTCKYLPLYEEKGTAEINGKTVTLALGVSGTPMVICGNKLFTLSWEQILEMADKEGIAE
jgi:hypothetical protein